MPGTVIQHEKNGVLCAGHAVHLGLGCGGGELLSGLRQLGLHTIDGLLQLAGIRLPALDERAFALLDQLAQLQLEADGMVG